MNAEQNLAIEIEREAVLQLASDKPFEQAVAELGEGLDIIDMDPEAGTVTYRPDKSWALAPLKDLLVYETNAALEPGKSESFTLTIGNEDEGKVMVVRSIIVKGFYA